MDGQLGASDELYEAIHRTWMDVIQTVNKLLHGHVLFGFESIAERIDPRLDDMVLSLDVLDCFLDAVDKSNFMSYDEKRMALDAKQCILNVRIAVDALGRNDPDAYHRAIKDLTSQPKI